MRWALAILTGSPPLNIAEKLEVQRVVTLRNPPVLKAIYRWVLVEPGVVHGVAALASETLPRVII